MALIACSECNRQISDQAAACPHCGAPTDGKPTTIQETAKQLKIHILIAYGFMGLALLLFFLPPLLAGGFSDASALPFFIGLSSLLAGVGWMIVTRVRIWWNHK